MPDENVVYVSYANEALGSTPYFIILRPERRAVCMCIRGTASFADLVTDLVGRPVDFKDWLPSSFVEEHNIQDARAHAGILAAAKAVLRDLNRHQILHTLLTGRPKEESSVDQDGAEPHSGRRTPEDFQRLLAERGIDCRGWDLYVCGHSLGAAIASLLLPHFAEWAPGKVIAWAFNPPGGLITQEVAAALEPRSKDVGVTSVIVGKDIISRTSNITFEHLQDQIVVALARTRLSKLGWVKFRAFCPRYEEAHLNECFGASLFVILSKPRATC